MKLHPNLIRIKQKEIIDQIDKLKKEFDLLNIQCSHEGTIAYCRDPSGNNDSGYYCSICQGEWKKNPNE